MKITSKFWNAFLLTAVMLMSFAVNVQAAVQPRLTDILISNDAESVLLYAHLVDGFKTDMEKAILAGVPTIFTMQLDVYQERSYVWDKKIISKEISRTIKYDNLKKTFSITTNGAGQPVILPDFESAQKSMADFNGIIAVPLSALTKGNQYYITMRVKIDKVRLPFHMEYVLIFASLWDFETAVYKKSFSY